MTILVIILFIIINIGFVLGLYFTFLRNLTPLQGYVSLAILISLLAIIDVFAFDTITKNLKKNIAEEIYPSQCTKEYVQKSLNRLSKFEISDDKNLIIAQLLQCFDGKNQIILVRHTMASSMTTITGKPSKIELNKYLQSLVTLNLGDSIEIDLIENNSAGLIMYLELSEKHIHKK